MMAARHPHASGKLRTAAAEDLLTEQGWVVSMDEGEDFWSAVLAQDGLAESCFSWIRHHDWGSVAAEVKVNAHSLVRAFARSLRQV